jgi:hypothetical protein
MAGLVEDSAVACVELATTVLSLDHAKRAQLFLAAAANLCVGNEPGHQVPSTPPCGKLGGCV